MTEGKMAKAVHQKLARNGTILVNYDHIVGEQEISAHVLIEQNGASPEDAIHEYFGDFWGSDTIVEEKGRRYAERYYQAAVKIRGWHEIPPEEAEILKKHNIG